MKNVENGGIEFLRAEALAGRTFSRIALESRYQEKTDRNRANARKAYDTLLRFMPRDNATPEVEEIRAKVAELQSMFSNSVKTLSSELDSQTDFQC